MKNNIALRDLVNRACRFLLGLATLLSAHFSARARIDSCTSVNVGNISWGVNDSTTPPYVVGSCSPVSVIAFANPCSQGAPTSSSISVATTQGGRYELVTNIIDSGSQASIYTLYPPTDPSQLPCVYTVTTTMISTNLSSTNANTAIGKIVFSDDGV